MIISTTYLQHWQEVAEEAAPCPVLNKSHHEGDGEYEQTLDDVRQSNVDEVATRGVPEESLHDDAVDGVDV